MGWRGRTVLFAVGLPLLGVCAATLYYLSRKEDDEWDWDAVSTNRSTVIEVEVPKDNVGMVIGRGGVVIKEIQEKSNTRITFKESNPDAEIRICRIRGSPESAQLAETMIHDLIVNQPVIHSLVLNVPQRACGRIIGRCGENIRAMSKLSNAQIIVDKTNVPGEEEKEVLIKGTAEQIAVAKSLIEAKVEEDDLARLKLNQTPTRNPRTKEIEVEGRCERLIASTTESAIQVYVSSVADPHNFWVQLINSRSAELDHLVEEMTEYYSQPENRELHTVKEVEVGQTLASQFEEDGKWYRVEVKEVGDQIDVFYLDYGDSAYQNRESLLHLSTNFLSLRFQAIHASLTNVQPPDGEETWPERSIVGFEEICYTGEWKMLLAQVLNYRENEGGARVPCLSLYDPTAKAPLSPGSPRNDIAAELVRRNLASFTPPTINLELPST